MSRRDPLLSEHTWFVVAIPLDALKASHMVMWKDVDAVLGRDLGFVIAAIEGLSDTQDYVNERRDAAREDGWYLTQRQNTTTTVNVHTGKADQMRRGATSLTDRAIEEYHQWMAIEGALKR